MKRILLYILSLIMFVALIGCDKKDENTLVVGVVAPPMSTVIEINKEEFEKLGYKLEIRTFTDYDIVNRALNDGEIDLNFSQHKLFMDAFNTNFDGNLVKLQGIYTTPIFLYSRTITKLEDINENTIIGVPREPINLARSLRLLKQLELISYTKTDEENVTLEDITKLKEFKIEQFELTGLPLAYPDIDMAVMYPSFGQRINLTVEKDTIAAEEDILPIYDISIVGREDNKDLKIVQDFIGVVASDRTKDYLFETFGETYRVVYK